MKKKKEVCCSVPRDSLKGNQIFDSPTLGQESVRSTRQHKARGVSPGSAEAFAEPATRATELTTPILLLRKGRFIFSSTKLNTSICVRRLTPASRALHICSSTLGLKPRLYADARFAGSTYLLLDPRAHAPGFMLTPASRALHILLPRPSGSRPRLYAS